VLVGRVRGERKRRRGERREPNGSSRASLTFPSGSPLEERLLWQIAAVGLPAPVREYQFAPPRRWRFDLAWPERRIAVEVEGGTWVHGRHVRGDGYRRDVDKYNAAVQLGWAVFRVTADMVRDGSALALLESVLGRSERSERSE
jgi:very-short-patch-repair endonuclease